MNALEIRQLRKTYANGVEALRGIDLIVPSGDFFALLGANGAGKSTTISLISHLLNKTSGSISIQGFDLDKQTYQAKACLGIVPQELNLNIFETCEQVLYGQAGYYGLSYHQVKAHANQLLSQLALWDKRHTQVRHLSGGMKRRLMIARALIHQPKLLILDEPTAGVDVEIRRHMWDFLLHINLKNTTIILTTHYLEEAERLCQNIAIIDQGRIIKHASMHDLLHTVQHHVYIINTMDPIIDLPHLTPHVITQLNRYAFQLRLTKSEIAINDLLNQLTQQGIRIRDIQNKTNRLEELFLDLINYAN